MATSIDPAKLEAVFSTLRKSPKDEAGLVEFLNIMKPIITLTLDRFPSHMSDDLSQEIKMFLMRKVEYLTKAFFDGRIKSPTNYFFRVCYNAGINYFNKEKKSEDHLLPIDDLKLEPIYKTKVSGKDKIIQQIREETLAFIKMHFKNKDQRVVAERFLEALLKGQRPSFNTGKVERFSHTERRPAKDTYSIVLIKVRELMSGRIDELLG